ncbi:MULTISPECIES: plasmid mobilization protein [Niastella]|uniref:Plasmid mobilization relaxosome protein MobC n=1 Tax=Niastella soli TaxID=2821487 RepID=A0ABS3YNS0_9BACT|nr:plasmid mobilization relaxosome protein MobC [Niastella soli]MBO9199533.1 plasmid mobilization relaxosome protein MobC [Niastella soli]
MEQVKKQTKNKGGRHKKAVKKDRLISVKCSSYERSVIVGKAKIAKVSTSEFMREVAMTGKIDRREKALAPEVLQLTAMLNHIAANLNQIAKKRNGFEELTVLERANLKVQSAELKQLATKIKSHLQ